MRGDDDGLVLRGELHELEIGNSSLTCGDGEITRGCDEVGRFGAHRINAGDQSCESKLPLIAGGGLRNILLIRWLKEVDPNACDRLALRIGHSAGYLRVLSGEESCDDAEEDSELGR